MFDPGFGILSPPDGAWCWLCFEPQRISNRPVGLGFHTVQGGIVAGDGDFRAQVGGVVVLWGDF